MAIKYIMKYRGKTSEKYVNHEMDMEEMFRTIKKFMQGHDEMRIKIKKK